MATFPLILTCAILLLLSTNISAKTYLKADGVSDPYSLINSVFGEGSSALELPDCNHTSFGPHITQVPDPILNSSVFAFHLHIRQDDDRCSRFDRQRNEIKTNENRNASLEDQLIGHSADRMTLSWNFKLDSGFQPPYSFCHIHQLKAVGGDDSMPLITLTPRRSNPNELQLLQYDSKGALHFLEVVPIQPFLGTWIHAWSDVTFGHNGSYRLVLSRWEDGGSLLDYTSSDIDLWRNETSFVRPKWGLYRSVQEAVLSRDETVLFSDFCVGVGPDFCL